MNLNVNDLMIFERLKALEKAKCELEIALNTFHGDSDYFDEFREKVKDLNDFIDDYLK